MNCNYCKNLCIKKGKRKNEVQKYQCSVCKKYQQYYYKNKACHPKVNDTIVRCLKHGSGIRDISAIAEITTGTVIKRIRVLADKIEKPKVKMHKVYEADELKTYVSKKKNEQWIIYAIDKKTRQVVDFRVGKRNKRNIKTVIDSLLFSNANRIFTDGLTTYKGLIPKEIHKVVPHNTNYIERKNLNLRTHIKRLTRRSICFSKSVVMLSAIMKIYFWA